MYYLEIIKLVYREKFVPSEIRFARRRSGWLASLANCTTKTTIKPNNVYYKFCLYYTINISLYIPIEISFINTIF